MIHVILIYNFTVKVNCFTNTLTVLLEQVTALLEYFDRHSGMMNYGRGKGWGAHAPNTPSGYATGNCIHTHSTPL